MRRILQAGTLAAGLAASAFAQQNAASLADVNAALQSGQADKALALLSSLPVTAASHNLKCRVLYTLEQWDAAASECQLAVKMDGQNSVYHMWLARALGERADRASFLSAYSLAKQVRAEFEQAVSLNPHNAAALADLGEFYYSAPSVVGGGDDKAAGIATQLDKVDAARAHELRGHMAEQKKDYPTAESEYKQSIAASAHPSSQWMTLASFYRGRQNWAALDAAIQSGMTAESRDHSAAVALYDGAAVLSKANRNLALAATMLEGYLADSSKTEDAPAFVAHTRLAQIKAQLGDKAGAGQERAAALALAHDYKPALNLKF